LICHRKAHFPWQALNRNPKKGEEKRKSLIGEQGTIFNSLEEAKFRV
jgi:hypothetical protein